MNIDPKYLAQLSTIVETGSFQTAANQLFMTQPGLSRNMRALEARLGTSLFDKQGRRSIPNALALKLARSGLAIRLAEEQASYAADQFAKGAAGQLRIGATPMVAGRFLTGILAQFIRKHPACGVELRTGLVHELKSMLESGQINMALGPQGLSDPSNGLDFQHLLDDRVGILCRAGHSLATRRSVLPSHLNAQTWLAHSRNSSLRRQTEIALLAAGITTVQIGIETDSIRSVLETVAMTDLITTMPRQTTAPYLKDQLVFLNFDHQQFERPLGIIRRRDTQPQVIETRFLEMLSKPFTVG